MIDKFNFYDVYGYFLPGLVLGAILWLPFGVVKDVWPGKDFGSAILAAALAYVLGHLLQMVSTKAISSRAKKDASGRDRYPSEILLDPKSDLPTEAKDKLASLVQIHFGLDLRIDKEGDEEIDKRRNHAFMLARQLLIREKATNYAEQFQGMYALTRGLVAALSIGCAYWLGWAVSIVRTSCLRYAAIVLAALCLLALFIITVRLFKRTLSRQARSILEIAYAWLCLLVFFTVGYYLGLTTKCSPNSSLALIFLAISALLGSMRAYSAYKFYTARFAITVWQDFLSYKSQVAAS